MFPFTPLVVAVIISVSVALFKLWRPRPRVLLPPGPRPLPLIGNAHQMPTQGQDWLTYSEWSKTYGDMFYLNVLGKPLIVVNSMKIATDLLHKQSAKYSERPTFQMAGELMGWSKSVVLSQYGDRLKRYRRLLQSVLGGAAAPSFRPLQEQEARRFASRMTQSPGDLVQHIRHNAAAVIMKIGYGYDVSSTSDRYISIAERALSLFASATVPGAHLVDLLPSLNSIPWLKSRFSRTAEAGRDALMEMVERPFNDVKASLQKAPIDEDGPKSFVATSLLTSADDDDHIQWAAASLYAGGADTTVSVVETFFLAMALYPEVQKRAREEVDRVCLVDSDGNPTRLPSIDDRASLPYTWAIYQECLRWGVVTPCQYHVARDEDMYALEDGAHEREVCIPKDTLIIVNAWSILHNPDTYPRPFEFDPTRYLPQGYSKPQPDPREVAFGWGRRRCPGIAIADDYVFITMCTALATLRISDARSKSGTSIPVPRPECELDMWRYTTGSISHPEPFDVAVIPRVETLDLLRKSD
ncbi:cytochrome P450 [Ceratobasidium sp. AG-I]|nr:cytochrome P450 [Ceratobasidium sp. AG-I]